MTWSVGLVASKLPVGWGSGDAGWEEAASAGWRVGVDGEALLVDDDVVVEPAQQGEVFWVVVAAVGLVFDVVGFEAVAGGAAVCGAAPVAVEDVVADALREPVAIPTPTYIDNTQLKVFHIEFCAIADKPLKSGPKAVHIWANQNRVYTETITWPDTTAEYCHKIDFSPAQWMESVGISVLVGYANRYNKVTLTKAWIALVP